MPLSEHFWISSPLIGREALEIWISPLQNSSNPPPVPEIATFTSASDSSANSSAIAWVIGKTVDDPSIEISFVGAFSVAASPPPPQAATESAIVTTRARKETVW